MGLLRFWRDRRLNRQRGQLIRSEYLDNFGWYISFESKSFRSHSHAHIHSQPVLPYPITELLDQTDWKDCRVFVRTDRNSYRWLLRRAKRVSSSNVEMHRLGISNRGRFETNPDVSIGMLSEYMAEHPACFDLMILDGPNKQEALPVILQGLSSRGVLAMSDDLLTEYDYQETVNLLHAKGFRTLQLRGPGPRIQQFPGVIAYRPGNILGI